MTMVGRSVLKNPRTNVGRIVNMKAKTTETAKMKPNIASLREGVDLPLDVGALVRDDDDLDVRPAGLRCRPARR